MPKGRGTIVRLLNLQMVTKAGRKTSARPVALCLGL